MCVCVCISLFSFVLCFAEQCRLKLRFECKPKCVLTVQIFFSSEQLFLGANLREVTLEPDYKNNVKTKTLSHV